MRIGIIDVDGHNYHIHTMHKHRMHILEMNVQHKKDVQDISRMESENHGKMQELHQSI